MIGFYDDVIGIYEQMFKAHKELAVKKKCQGCIYLVKRKGNYGSRIKTCGKMAQNIIWDKENCPMFYPKHPHLLDNDYTFEKFLEDIKEN